MDIKMETIKEFLNSEIYLDTLKELDLNNFNNEIQSVEIDLLRNRLKQRQFLIEGFNCKLHSEKESVEFFRQMIEENREDIIIWSKKFWQYCDGMTEEYPNGEFLEGEEISEDDKSTLIEIGKYSLTSVDMYIIELDILMNHQEKLVDYYNRVGVHGAVKYAIEMKKLYKSVFS